MNDNIYVYRSIKSDCCTGRESLSEEANEKRKRTKRTKCHFQDKASKKNIC